MAINLTSFDFVVVPGRENAPGDHWQSHWLAVLPNSTRVLQADWARPQVDAWTAQLGVFVAAAPRRVVLIGHSVGVATIIRWTDRAPADLVNKVAAAFLVAPTQVGDPDPSFDLVRNFAPLPLTKLPYPAVVAASRDDPRVAFPQARAFAEAWGAELFDVGEQGHIGTQARLGMWPAGLLQLGGLLARVRG